MGNSMDKEAKRLRRSVKNRRLYVDNLRRTARTLRGDVDGPEREPNAAFAAQLDGLADRELAAAREEDRQARDIETRPKGEATWRPDPGQARRAAEVMTRLAGSFARDRVEHLLGTLGIADTGSDLGAAMTEVERRLGIIGQTQPEGGPRMLMGARIDLAETTAFGVPRF